MTNTERIITYQYDFRLADGTEKRFTVRLDGRDLGLLQPRRGACPGWTALQCRQCANCPLEAEAFPHCPVAVSLVELVEFFRESLSYEEVDVRIETCERKYSKRTSTQAALSSLLGIYMVTSGCPVMDKLRPMVRFHLPFATVEETAYRAVSMYLMAQYFRYRRRLKPDWTLENLVHLYEEVQTVNQGFMRRLQEIEMHDASTNALIILDCFASYVMISIDEDDLSEFEILFKPYLEEGNT